MAQLIKKMSGIKEPFNEHKIIRSLQRIGASKEIIDEVLNEIKRQYPNIKSTKQIFSIALALLKEKNVALASRYNIKKAILAFGPAGYPFEHFIAELVKKMGYETLLDQYVRGFCVEHEVDIIATKAAEHHMIECKFHNKQRYKSDVKVPLYIKARFDDIRKEWERKPQDTPHLHKSWIVTNTSFTQEAITYAECSHMNLMSWKYPTKFNLRDLITKYELHPITALVNLSAKQKKAFLKNGLVLCRDAAKHVQLLKRFGFSPEDIDRLIKEAQATCKIN